MSVSTSPPTTAPRPALSMVWYRALKPWHRLLMRSYFQVEIDGREYLPSGRAAVLAIKHVSKWDPLAIALLQPDPLYYIARADEFQGVQGWFMTRLGAFPVGRESAQAATIKATESILLAQKTLAIFPEGKLVPDGVGEIKPGLGRIVTRFEAKYDCAIPVVPVAIAYDPAPKFRAKVTIAVRPPLFASELCGLRVPGDAKDVSRQKEAARVMTEAISSALISALDSLRAA
ncbi:MAG: lysophospholipid acyltransferase family protein [Cyanobacteria bacterium J06639_1]